MGRRRWGRPANHRRGEPPVEEYLHGEEPEQKKARVVTVWPKPKRVPKYVHRPVRLEPMKPEISDVDGKRSVKPHVDRGEVVANEVVREIQQDVLVQTLDLHPESLVEQFPYLEGVPLQEIRFVELYLTARLPVSHCARVSGVRSLHPGMSPRQILELLFAKKPIAQFVAEWQAEKQRLASVTLEDQLRRLSELGRGAQEAGQFSAAISAEKLRMAVVGMTTDRRHTVVEEDRGALVAKLRSLLSDPSVSASVRNTIIDVTGGDLVEDPALTGRGRLPAGRDQAVTVSPAGGPPSEAAREQLLGLVAQIGSLARSPDAEDRDG